MGLRGPAPKSRDAKILAGTFRRDRDQGATIAPAPLSELPRTPSWLSKVGKAEWRRMATELNAINALSAIDLGALEGYCASYARAVAAEAELAKAKTLTTVVNNIVVAHPLIATAKHAWAEMRTFASKLGATPADRTRVKPLGAPAAAASEDPWAKIANG